MQIYSESSASFTRPTGATQYSVGDLVADTTVAASVIPLKFIIARGNGRGIRILEWHIQKSDGADITGADFDLVLFHGTDTAPVTSAGDNDAFFASNAYNCAGAGYLGTLAGGQMYGFSDDAFQVYHLNQTNTITHVMHDSSIIWGFLLAQATYTPADSEVFTVTLSIEHYNA